MSTGNPYRAAGTFDGPSYVTREADHALMGTIHGNKRFPYLLAPRQSGKSSLLVRTAKRLDRSQFRPVFVDLSKFPPSCLSGYDEFLNKFVWTAAKALGTTYSGPDGDFEEAMRHLLEHCHERIVLFMDEVDVLLPADFKDAFFSMVRSLFNERALQGIFERVIFVLSGAAQPGQLISDPLRSPFNVGEKIRLEDLSVVDVELVVSHLRGRENMVSITLANDLYRHTRGSVYLTQLVLERLWERHAGKPGDLIDAAVVDRTVDEIVRRANDDIHFRKIYDAIYGLPSVRQAFCELYRGWAIKDRMVYECLNITGILGREGPFRNPIYERVFGPGGPLAVLQTKGQGVRDNFAVSPAPFVPETGTEHALAPPDELPWDGNQSSLLLMVGGQLVAPPELMHNTSADYRGAMPAYKFNSAENSILGQYIEGYRVTRLIGRGGMGEVYEAIEDRIAHRAAVKVLYPEFSEDQEAVDRFVAEVHAASRVRHAGLVQILSHGRLPSGTAYILMEYLNGESLQARLRRLLQQGQRLPLGETLRIGQQIASALSALHREGITHRDLKPANLLLVDDPDVPSSERIKVVDFGIAKFDSGTETGVGNTTVGRFLGTAQYASPEQCQMAGLVDHKADVYSLGVLLYEMLGGQPPFAAPQPGVVIGMHIFMQPRPIWELAPTIPRALHELIHQMLAKRPEDRPSMEEVFNRLSYVKAEGPQFLWRLGRHKLALIGAVGAMMLMAGLGVAWHFIHAPGHGHKITPTAEVRSIPKN